MSKFIKPERLRAGDTVCTISLSGGRAGDADMTERYLIGKRRLSQIFGLNVIETTNSQKGSDFLYKNPKARADDLMEAIENPNVKGIFLNTGGDDGIRLLPYIDFNRIKTNPKVFVGFSDGDTFHHMFTYAGVSSFYGANILATIAEPGELNPYTIRWMKKVLFLPEIIGSVEPCDRWTPINWNAKSSVEIEWHSNTGYKVYQGAGKVTGHIMGFCSGPLQLMLGTCLFPSPDLWKDSIICLEVGASYGIKLAGVHMMRAFTAAGMFTKAKALIIPRLPEEAVQDIIIKVLHEAGLYDLPVFSGLEFTHSNPMTLLPIGVNAEVDCDNNSFTILESGVV